MKKRQRISKLKRKERITGLLFITPLYLYFLIFTLFFMFYSFYMAFTDWDIISRTQNFVGFQNFVSVFQDEIFWKAVRNTLYLMLGTPICMVLALMMAMALNRKFRGKALYRVIVYLPSVTSAVAIAVLWRFIYNKEYGVINLLIRQLTGLEGPNWLGDADVVKIALIIMGIWHSLGNNMLLFLAGLQSISPDYYEVIDVEGGNSFHKFRYVTLPMLTPVIFYMVITGVIHGLQQFGNQFVMTGMGPEYSTITIVYYLYQKGFVQSEMGVACAVAWIVASVIFVVTLLQFKVSNRWVYKD